MLSRKFKNDKKSSVKLLSRVRERDFYLDLLGHTFTFLPKYPKEPGFQNNTYGMVTRYIFDEIMIQEGRSQYFAVLRNSTQDFEVAILYEKNEKTPKIRSSLIIPKGKCVDHFRISPMTLPDIFRTLISSNKTKNIGSGFDLCYEIEILFRKTLFVRILATFIYYVVYPILVLFVLEMFSFLVYHPLLFTALLSFTMPLVCVSNAFIKKSDLTSSFGQIHRIIFPTIIVIDYILEANYNTMRWILDEIIHLVKCSVKEMKKDFTQIRTNFMKDYHCITSPIRKRYAQPWAFLMSPSQSSLYMRRFVSLYLYFSIFPVIYFVGAILNRKSLLELWIGYLIQVILFFVITMELYLKRIQLYHILSFLYPIKRYGEIIIKSVAILFVFLFGMLITFSISIIPLASIYYIMENIVLEYPEMKNFPKLRDAYLMLIISPLFVLFSFTIILIEKIIVVLYHYWIPLILICVLACIHIDVIKISKFHKKKIELYVFWTWCLVMSFVVSCLFVCCCFFKM